MKKNRQHFSPQNLKQFLNAFKLDPFLMLRKSWRKQISQNLINPPEMQKKILNFQKFVRFLGHFLKKQCFWKIVRLYGKNIHAKKMPPYQNMHHQNSGAEFTICQGQLLKCDRKSGHAFVRCKNFIY